MHFRVETLCWPLHGSIEDINLLLDDAKPLDRLDYVSYAAGVLGLRSNTLGMLPMLGAVAVCWLLRVLLDLSARKLTQIRGGRASRYDYAIYFRHRAPCRSVPQADEGSASIARGVHGPVTSATLPTRERDGLGD